MANVYVIRNGSYVMGTDNKPKPMTYQSAFEFVMESSRRTAELIRSNWDDSSGRYNRFYVDKEGVEYWTTTNPEKIPNLY